MIVFQVAKSTLPAAPYVNDPMWSDVVALIQHSSLVEYISDLDLDLNNAALDTAYKRYGTSSIALYTSDSGVSGGNMIMVAGDFTIEGWFRLDQSVAGVSINVGGSVLATSGLDWMWNSTRVAANSVILGLWQHVAVTRTAGLVRLFVDGVEKSSGMNSSDLGGSQLSLSGIMHVDQFRVTLASRYTADFTPPGIFHIGSAPG